MFTIRHSYVILLLLLISTSCRRPESVDLIVRNGKIYTVDSAFTQVEAMAIRDGRIVATGRTEDLLQRYEADSILDAEGKTIVPGLIDAHAHYLGYGYTLQQAELTGAMSWEETVERVKGFARQQQVVPGQWILGRGWDQNDWSSKKFPTRDLLDEAFPDNPVMLERVDGHAVVVNAKALEAANITTPVAVTGGEVVADNGRPTGVLVDRACDLVYRVIPANDRQRLVEAALDAQKNLFAEGITTVVDCGEMAANIDVLDSLHKSGSLKIRLVELLSDDSTNYAIYLTRGPYKTDRLHVAGFKIYADGALGSRGACLLEPYSDRPDWRGFTLRDRAHYEQVARLLADTRFQACTHAIGDSGNRMVLQVYADVLKGKNDRRWRIEHAQVVHPDDFHWFGLYSIIPSVQPTHATSDMYWAADRLGSERVKGAYAYKQLLKENGWMPLGTDFPVEHISAFKTFFAAVVRQDAKGFPAGGFQMENALTREEALRGMTIWAARGSFEEQEKGSLEPGKVADFVILDRDLMTCAENEILGTRVWKTFVAGERVF